MPWPAEQRNHGLLVLEVWGGRSKFDERKHGVHGRLLHALPLALWSEKFSGPLRWIVGGV